MDKENWNSNGPQVLEHEQAKQILTDFECIVDEIEEIRQQAEIQRKNKYQVNNTFSILAGRGMGKTSILLTVKKELKLENSQGKTSFRNIIFPLLEPFHIENHSDLFGCILAQIEDKLEDFLKKVKQGDWDKEKMKDSDLFRDCIYKENNKLIQKFDELVEYYLYSHPDYRKLLSDNYTDLNSHVKKTKQMLSGSIGLKMKFFDFINLWVEKITFFYNEEPLFFFFFDDIDLCPNKIVELVKIINHYLSHPNIVGFVAGDLYEMKNVLSTYYALEEKNVSNINVMLSDIKIEANHKKLAENTILKLLPINHRKILNIWTDISKPLFTMKKDVVIEEKYLGDVLRKIQSTLYGNDCEEVFGYTIFEDGNGSKNEDGESSGYMYFPKAFSMFSEQTRKLKEELHVAMQLLEAVQNKKKDKEQKYYVKQFLQTILMEPSNVVTLLKEENSFDDFFEWNGESSEVNIFMHNIVYTLMYSGGMRGDYTYNNEPTVLYYFYTAFLLLKEHERKEEIKRIYYESFFGNTYNILREWITPENSQTHYLLELLVKSDLVFGMRFMKLLIGKERSEGINSEEVLLELFISIYFEVMKERGGKLILKEEKENNCKFLRHLRNIKNTKFYDLLINYTTRSEYGFKEGINNLCKRLENELEDNRSSSKKELLSFCRSELEKTLNLLSTNYFEVGTGVYTTADKEAIKQILCQKCSTTDETLIRDEEIKELAEILSEPNDMEIYHLLDEYRKVYEDDVIQFFVYKDLKSDGVLIGKDIYETIEIDINSFEQNAASNPKVSRIYITDYALRRNLFGTPCEIYLLAQEYLKLCPIEEDEDKQLLRNWLQYVKED